MQAQADEAQRVKFILCKYAKIKHTHNRAHTEQTHTDEPKHFDCA